MGQVQDVAVQFHTHRAVESLTRPSNTTAYAAGDVISAVTTNDHFTFAGAVRNGTKSKQLGGAFVTARLHSSSAVATSLDAELYLFSADIAEVADNSAFAPTDDEMLTCIGVIDFPTADWKFGTLNSFCQVTNLGIAFKAATTTIYGQLVARNAYVPTSAEVFTIELIISQD